MEKDPHKHYTIPPGEFATKTLGEKTGAFKPVADIAYRARKSTVSERCRQET